MFIFKTLVRILAPNLCIRCGKEGAITCRFCLPLIAYAKSSTCFMCNSQTDNFTTCKNCRRKTRLRRVYVAGYYDGYVKDLITRFKYSNAMEASSPLAALVTTRISAEHGLIVPVPSSSKRFRQRGYNPAHLLAKEISKHTGAVCVETLGRIGHSRQVGTDRRKRLAQLQGAFYACKPELIKGKKILLIDDVVTTGATLSECAEVLHRHGAKKIDAAVVAKH